MDRYYQSMGAKYASVELKAHLAKSVNIEFVEQPDQFDVDCSKYPLTAEGLKKANEMADRIWKSMTSK